MTLSLLPTQDAITAKLKELPQDVYENAVPDDATLSYSTSGKLLPFMVANYSGFVQMPGERGIIGARFDIGRSYLSVYCVGPSERSSRQAADLVLDLLTGFQPANATQLEPENVGKPFVIYDSTSKPMKFVSEVSFTYAVNTVVS